MSTLSAARRAGPVSLRVLTVNTHKGFTSFNRRFVLHELREAVRQTGADIVFLQEVLGTHARHSMRYPNWPKTSQYEFLADSIWSDFAYGRNAVYPHGDHGNAVLSKFPIVRYANRDVSVGARERRGLLHCVVQLPTDERQMHAFCVHLGLREQQRRRQLELLCQEIDRSVPADAPLLVAGDFNDWRVRAHGRLREQAGLREVFVEAFGNAARTFPARWPVLQLDRIYVRNVDIHRPVVLQRRPWSHLSDHSPLVAEIQL
ncbi:MAG: endonuclease/exonuclease/phosphatase family protein [Burkholderiaceae bacterium]